MITTAEIDVRGVIVSNDDVRLYKYFGIEATCPRAIGDALRAAGGEPVTVHINCMGGDVWSASEIYTALRAYAGGVTTVATGLAASAASIILAAGNAVRASPTAEIMIHNPISRAEGDYRAMEHEAKALRNTRDAMLNAYEIKSGPNGATREKLRQMMDRETWLTAQGAKKAGLVDEILFASDDVALPADESENEPDGGEAGVRAALCVPSVATLRAQKAVWDEIAPGARSVAEARMMLQNAIQGNRETPGIGLVTGAAARLANQPVAIETPQGEVKPPALAEKDGELEAQKRLMRERIKALGA